MRRIIDRYKVICFEQTNFEMCVIFYLYNILCQTSNQCIMLHWRRYCKTFFLLFFLKKEFILGNKKYVELRYSTKYVPKDFTHDFLRPLFY